MILRAQTVRRLLILQAAVMVLVGAGAALLWVNEHRKAQRLAETREKGMAAFQSGDYPAALESLKYYVAREGGKKDPEALFAYGMSRARIEESNGKHVLEGITVFNTLIQ